VLCPVDEHGGKGLTKGWAAKYAENKDKRDLFSNMTTVLPAFGPVELPTDTPIGGSRVIPSHFRLPRGSKWQVRRIIPDQRSFPSSIGLGTDTARSEF
jgi:hypothetical protein